MSAGSKPMVAVITGVSRAEGLGFEVARQLGARGISVVITARNLAEVRRHAATLAAEGLNVRAMALDVTSDSSAAGLAAELTVAFGHIDIQKAGKTSASVGMWAQGLSALQRQELSGRCNVMSAAVPRWS